MGMVKYSPKPDGSGVAYAVAEVTAVPYYELLHQDRMKATVLNQAFFTQCLSGLIRSSEPETTAYEIILQSVPVSNQTYSAQVRMYFVIRKAGWDREAQCAFVAQHAASFANDLEQHHFSVSFFETNAEYVDFMRSVSTVDCRCAAAVSKKEQLAGNLYGTGGMYFNPAIVPTEAVNLTLLTNPLTQYPGSAISLQIIPTVYQENERAALLQTNSMVNLYCGEVRRMQGMMPLDPNMQALLNAFAYYCRAVNEPVAYVNFMVYSAPDSLHTLCNKIISTIEDEIKSNGSALEITEIRNSRVSLSENFHSAPWHISQCLVQREREMQFWTGPNAPVMFMRLKYLMTLNEIRTIFKFPIDDGTAIGLETRKVQVNREKLHNSIISKDNFQMGVIQSSGGAIAGVPLNDFTKHGLIVGTPGSGKTNFSLGFLLQMWQEFHIPFIAVEPTKTEYRSLADAIRDIQIFTPGKSGVSPYIINPFIPPTGVTVETYVPSLMTAFKAAFSMPDPLPEIFLGAMNECYNEYGWRMDSTKDDPNVEIFGMFEFIRVFKRRIQNMDYRGDVKANMEAAGVVRLVSLIEQNALIYDSIHTIPLEDLLSKPTVIELNAINNAEQKSLIMALFLMLICVYTKNNVENNDGRLKNILLIDEAHVLLGGGGSGGGDGAADPQSTTIKAVEDMIAEIRSYGTSIIIADQAPTKVGKNIVANTLVKVMFRLVEKDNKEIIRSATNMKDADYEMLGKLGVGEAMLHYGRVFEPLHIKTFKLDDVTDRLGVNRIRAVIPDKEIAAMSHYWDTRAALLIPHRECVYNCKCSEQCDMKIRSEGDYIATRLLNRFRTEVNTLDELLRILSRLDQPIAAIAAESGQMQPELKLVNCAKIKFLRKVLLTKSIRITKEQYREILSHKSFLKKEEQADG